MNPYVDKSVDEGHYGSDQHKALRMEQRIPKDDIYEETEGDRRTRY